MIKFVFLDLDDTLLDFHLAERIALKATFDTVGVPSDDKVLARYSEINRSCWQRLERGEWTRTRVLVGRFRLLFDELGIFADPEMTQQIYEDRLCIGHYFMPGAMDMLNALFGKYKLYITSNGTARVQDSRIASANIARYFDGIFISQRVGADKPSRRFFDTVFSAIDGFARDDAVILGDSLTSDILGGLNAGIRTVYYNPRGKAPRADITPDHEIRVLSEFPELLKKM